MITEGNTREIYDITGLTPLAGGYEFTFPYSSSQDVRVYTTGNRIDTEVPSSNYTIDKSGATPKVVFNAGYSFPAGQTRLTIIRNVSYSQELDLRNGDLIDADKLEGALDDITQQIQQVAEKVDRAILASVSDTVPLSIPESTERSNMLLGFNNEGKVIPVLTTDIEQKLAQALAAEESAITAKNAAETAQHEAEAAQIAAETAQVLAETAQSAAETAEASSQTLLASIATKTEESIASINTAKTGAVGAVSTQQATSVAAVQAAQNTAESDIAGKRASALTAIDSAKTSAVAAVNTQKETSVAAADREIVAKRDSALSDIQTARTNASNAITSQKDSSLQEIEQLASERKAEINSLAANQKADVKQYTDAVVAAAKTEIDTEKTTAITAVQEEGTTQVAAVQAIYAEDYARVTAENNALKVEVARNRRQIENLNDRLDGDLIENKFKMTGETPDDAGVLSLPPSKLLPNAEVDEVHGKTFVWNQLFTYVGVNRNYSGIVVNGNVDGLKVTGTGTKTDWTYSLINWGILSKRDVGHVAICYGLGNETDDIYLKVYSNGLNGEGVPFVISESFDIRTYYKAVTYDVTLKPKFIDLTTLFGVTDTSQVTVAMKSWARAYVEAHPEYNAGTLLNSIVNRVKSSSRNIWDEEWENGILSNTTGAYIREATRIVSRNYIPCTPNATLFLCCTDSSLNQFRICFYDSSYGFVSCTDNFAKNRAFQVPANARYMKFSNNGVDITTYRNNICINVTDSKNGTYSPHLVGTISTNVELKVGDTYYPATGMVQPTMKELVFNENTAWAYRDDTFYTQLADSPNDYFKVISVYKQRDTTASLLADGELSTYGTNVLKEVRIKDSRYTSLDAFKSAMVGQKIVYELATTPEPVPVADPIDNGLAIESNGTITVECEGAQAEALVHYAIDNRSN